jgi:hypothetical protein
MASACHQRLRPLKMLMTFRGSLCNSSGMAHIID